MAQKSTVVHHFDGSQLVGSRGVNIYRSQDGGSRWRFISEVTAAGPFVGRLRYHLGIGRLGRRLVRGGLRHVVTAGDALVVVSGKRFYRVGLDGQVAPGAPCVGSNPLCTPAVVFCTPAVVSGSTADATPSLPAIFYGEYRANPERSPVHVWRSNDGSATFLPVWTFTNVRHIHGVFTDPFDPDALWVTTGDDDDESAIWRTTDSFRTLKPVVQGGQQARAVDLIFTEDALYFGSDTPREQNYLYRLDRRTGTVTQLQPVAGSVFWGRTTPDGWKVLSTVVEKSAVNPGRDAELWAAPPGRDDWRCILRLRKDPFHDKYFDHGQIRLAAGPGIPGAVWVTPYAVQGDQRSRYIELASSWAAVSVGDGRP